MTYFEWCQYAYEKGWATNEKLQIWVQAGKITAEEYQIITGEVYPN